MSILLVVGGGSSLGGTVRVFSSEELANGQVVRVALERRDFATPPAAPLTRFEHCARERGELRLRTLVPVPELILFACSSDGTLLGLDDGDGGRRCASLHVDAERDDLVLFGVRTIVPTEGETIELRFTADQETSAAREAARKALNELAAWEARSTGVLSGGVSEYERLVASLRAVPGWLASGAIDAALDRIAASAYGRGMYPIAADVWESLRPRWEDAFPSDHPARIQSFRNLAAGWMQTGRNAEAREVLEELLAIGRVSLGEDDPIVARLISNLALLYRRLGDSERALPLLERFVALGAKSRPSADPVLCNARLDLGATLMALGELEGALKELEGVVSVLTLAHPVDEIFLARARNELARIELARGNAGRAAMLFEDVVQVRSRLLPADDLSLQVARMNLAVALRELGDLQGARTLFRGVVDSLSRVLGPASEELLRARMNLAVTMGDLGDHVGARTILEEVLAAGRELWAETDVSLLNTQDNLAIQMSEMGDEPAALRLREALVQGYSAALSADHPMVLRIRGLLAVSLKRTGRLAEARAIEEEIVSVLSRSAPPSDPELGSVLENLADTRYRSGDLAGAREILEERVVVCRPILGDEHPEWHGLLARLLPVLVKIGDAPAALRTALELSTCLRKTVEGWIGRLTPRELESLAVQASEHASEVLLASTDEASLPELRALGPQCLELVESLRSAALMSAAAQRFLGGDPGVAEVRERERRSSQVLADLANSSADVAAIDRAARELEDVRRERIQRLAERSDWRALLVEPDLEHLSAELAEGEAMVGYWKYFRRASEEGQRRVEPRLLAFVIRPGARLARVEFENSGEIELLVERWRAALGAQPEPRGVASGTGDAAADPEREIGLALRRALFDPLMPFLGDARTLTVVPDDFVHAVPLDALPLEEGIVGDRFTILLRSSLREMLLERPASQMRGVLVAAGGLDYDANEEDPDSLTAQLAARAQGEPPPSTPPDSARGTGADGAFEPLPGALAEIEGLRDIWSVSFAAEPELLLGSRTGRATLRRAAPRAAWLHLATHGWVARVDTPSEPPSAERSSRDPQVPMLSPEEHLGGVSPMVLCGLALAGANLPPDPLGRRSGLVTAEEMATWELSACELAVLSACDTNVGLRRTGQGVASLQRALHMAGARSVITSLWRVPDGTTKELMLDFYRRLWAEKKPKWQALWEAKMTIRNAKSDDGRPRYSTRDWAGWVLSGEPR